MTHHILVVCFLPLLMCPAEGGFVEDMTRLNDVILGNSSGYDKNVQPNSTVDISVLVILKSLINMNIDSQSMEFKYIVGMAWTDPRLAFNASQYGNIAYTRMETGKIWMPPVYVENRVSSEGVLESSLPVFIYSSGLVSLLLEVTSETECSVSTQYYPFDKQNCDFKLLYWGLTADASLTPSAEPISYRWYSTNGEWDIVDSKAETSNLQWSAAETMPRIVFSFTLKRRQSYYLTAIIVPVLLLSVLIVAVFWVPVDSGEKMGYCLTVLLTYTLFLSIVSDELPPIATDISYLQLYLALSMGLGVVATLLTTLTLHLYHKGNTPLPGWLEKMNNTCILPVTCQRPCPCPRRKAKVMEGFHTDTELPPKPETTETSMEELEDKVTYQQLAVSLDRFFLLLYTVTMVLTTMIFLILMGSGA